MKITIKDFYFEGEHYDKVKCEILNLPENATVEEITELVIQSIKDTME